MSMRLITKLVYTSFNGLLLLALYSCGNNSGDPVATVGRGGALPGALTISITDAAVDSAKEVWVQFSGASIKPTDGDAIQFTFDAVQNINLLDLQGTLFSYLIKDNAIPAGHYDWVRLNVNASNDNVTDSYIVLDDGSVHELWIPSGSETGLKINTGFEIAANEKLNLMIDFDLRKSVVVSNGSYTLRPTLRMMPVSETGTITGTIDSALLIEGQCSDNVPATGNAVYLYAGKDIVPVDIRNGGSGPLTSAGVYLNASSGNYEYTIGYVLVGEYTLAFTCQADLDVADVKDSLIFSFSENITVIADSDSPGPVIVPFEPVR